MPAGRWKSGAGEVTFAAVGPGAAFLTLEEAARRLKITVRELEVRAKLVEVGGWGGFVALSEVERLERAYLDSDQVLRDGHAAVEVVGVGELDGFQRIGADEDDLD